jgi:hypothetical protein
MTRLLRLILAAAAVAAVGGFAAASQARNGGEHARSGALHATKECSQYFGRAGDYCTITSSSLNAIQSGMRVVYTSPAGATSLGSDLVLDGPGNNNALGHVTLDFTTLSGVVTLNGGTGRFRGFHASVDVTYDTQAGSWRWDGTYSFTPPGHDG